MDYGSDSIRIGRWIRAYDEMSNPLLEDLKVELNLTRVSRAEALSEVEGHRTPVALFVAGMSFKSLMPFVSVRESIELVRVFDRTAARSGARPRIVSEAEARSLMEGGSFVFVPPSPSKSDVIESGLRGKLFPPKVHTPHDPGTAGWSLVSARLAPRQKPLRSRSECAAIGHPRQQRGLRDASGL